MIINEARLKARLEEIHESRRKNPINIDDASAKYAAEKIRDIGNWMPKELISIYSTVTTYGSVHAPPLG